MKQKQNKKVLSIPRWITQNECDEPRKRKNLKRASGGEDIPEYPPAAGDPGEDYRISNYEKALNRRIAAGLMPFINDETGKKTVLKDFSTTELNRLKNILQNNRAADTDTIIVETAENLLGILA